MFNVQVTDGTTEEASGIALGIFWQIWGSLESSYGPAGPFYAVAALGMLLALIALPVLLKKEKDPFERLSFDQERGEEDLVSLRGSQDDGRMQNFAPLLEPTDEEELSATRKELRSAGYRGESAVRLYSFARAAGGLGMLLFGVVFTLLIPAEPNIVFASAISALMGLAGFFAPVYWVKRQIAARQEEIRNSFPDAMDMMLVCIEGGQSLDQAMARVGEEMKTSGTPLADELEQVSTEFRAGKDRTSVLCDLAERCSVNDISSFVTVLIQSQTFGTSISQALRVYASEMRDKRLMRAEEKANVLPTKLTLGTMVFTVPPLILILVGPSVIEILRSVTALANQ